MTGGFAQRRLSNKSLETAEAEDSIEITKRIEKLAQKFTTLYQKTEMIHDGGRQGRIFKAKCMEDGKVYVVKTRPKSRLRLFRFFERKSEAYFRHMTERTMNIPETENLVNIHACYEDSSCFYTVQEVCEGGDLHDFYRYYLKDYAASNAEGKAEEVRVVAREMLLSLQQFHAQGLVHKDVKLENLAFKEQGGVTFKRGSGNVAVKRFSPESSASTVDTEGDSPPQSPKTLKLIDFGFTEEWEPSSPKGKEVVGTDGYIAPEAYLGNSCPKSDIFAAGIVVYVLMTGRFPHDDDIFNDGPGQNYVGGPKMQEIYTKLQKSEVQYGKVWDSLPEARDFVEKLMEFDVATRPDAAEALTHPWLQN